jgi:membrane-associated phospholipid phosphatase
MVKKILASIFVSVASLTGFSQTDSVSINSLSESSNAAYEERTEPVYKLKPKVDIPLTLITGGWSGFAFTKIYSKDRIPESTVAALRKEDVNGFDRWAAGMSSEKAANASDMLFYGSMPLPIVLLADKHIRKDAGKIGFLYLEAMSITGLLYTGSTFLTNRYRPETYATELPVADRTSGGNKNSFFAGHVALVGTSTFFTAKVFADYHPESKLRYVFYGIAAASTAATGYLRHRAGKHFPSDVIIGTTVGTLSGILVPHFHKYSRMKNNKMSIIPFAGNSNGLAITYKL